MVENLHWPYNISPKAMLRKCIKVYERYLKKGDKEECKYMEKEIQFVLKFIK